jgi:sec-independent protein translocase protein TatA
MFGELGLPELLLILCIALLIFGPSKLGGLGKSLGEAIRNFRSAMSGSESSEEKADKKNS